MNRNQATQALAIIRNGDGVRALNFLTTLLADAASKQGKKLAASQLERAQEAVAALESGDATTCKTILEELLAEAGGPLEPSDQLSARELRTCKEVGADPKKYLETKRRRVRATGVRR